MPVLPASSSPADPPFVGGAAALSRSRERLVPDLVQLYGPGQAEAVAARLLKVATAAATERPEPLRALDRARSADPGWFLAGDRVGYSAYVDRFCGTLAELPDRVGWLADLGVTYLHLLPLLKMRVGDNDGGFAVSDFGAVDPRFGRPGDLAAAADALRARGVSLCLDLVLNHVADDHPWAEAARAGDPGRRAFFHVLYRPEEVEAAERHLAQVFPATAPGNFTRVDALDGWVWTTFYPFQWDLNWSNPEVMVAVAEALLRLANQGVEVFRLDSVPYLWKRIGTASKDLPEAHAALRVLRSLTDLACPAVLLKAEAVTATARMADYLGTNGPEAHIAYHNSLMVALWTSLAEGDARAISRTLSRTPQSPPDTNWALYARCHDDIGWHLLLADEGEGARARAERLTGFYADRDGGFARGVAFQEGSGALASCGMLASLAGLEGAEQSGKPAEIECALARVRLLHGLIACLPGLPILYMGDEIGLPNDAEWRSRDRFAEDERGLNRPFMDWARAEEPVAQRVLADLKALLALRRSERELRADAPAETLPSEDARVLIVRRGVGDGALHLTVNLSGADVELTGVPGGRDAVDLLSGRAIRSDRPLRLGPYAFLILRSGAA